MLNKLLAGAVIGVSSSNWSWYQYDQAREILRVGYLNGKGYAYGNVSLPEAISLLYAPSAGTWGWDNLRVRGKGNARRTRKPFGRL